MLHQPIQSDPVEGFEHVSAPLGRVIESLTERAERVSALAASITALHLSAGRSITTTRARAAAGTIVEYGNDLERAISAALAQGWRDTWGDLISYESLLKKAAGE
jgi:hypothetical protein